MPPTPWTRAGRGLLPDDLLQVPGTIDPMPQPFLRPSVQGSPARSNGPHAALPAHAQDGEEAERQGVSTVRGRAPVHHPFPAFKPFSIATSGTRSASAREATAPTAPRDSRVAGAGRPQAVLAIEPRRDVGSGLSTCVEQARGGSSRELKRTIALSSACSIGSGSLFQTRGGDQNWS